MFARISDPAWRIVCLVLLLAAAPWLLGQPLPGAWAQAQPVGEPHGEASAAADIEPLWQKLRDRRASVRARALEQLAEQGPEIVPGLLERLDDADMRVRLACVRLLAEFAPEQALAPLVARLDDEAQAVREQARLELLDLPVEDLADRLAEQAEQWTATHGYTPLGLERLLVVLRFRLILEGFERWRTPQSRSGMRIPNQYASVLRERPEAAQVLIDFVRQPEVTGAELGPDWRLGEALLAAVRCLADAEETPPGAAAAISELTARLSQGGHGRFVQSVPISGGSGDAALLAVAQVALYRMGTDEANVESRLDSWQRSLASHPSPSSAWRLAATYIELGEAAEALRYLRIAARISRAAGGRRGGNSAELYLHLAALTLHELEEMEAAGIDPEEVFEDPELEAELRRIRPDQRMIIRPGEAVADLERLAMPAEPVSEELAMRHLRTALEMGFSDATWLLRDPRLERLHEREDFGRYVETLERIYGAIDDHDNGDRASEDND